MKLPDINEYTPAKISERKNENSVTLVYCGDHNGELESWSTNFHSLRWCRQFYSNNVLFPEDNFCEITI